MSVIAAPRPGNDTRTLGYELRAVICLDCADLGASLVGALRDRNGLDELQVRDTPQGTLPVCSACGHYLQPRR